MLIRADRLIPGDVIQCRGADHRSSALRATLERDRILQAIRLV